MSSGHQAWLEEIISKYFCSNVINIEYPMHINALILKPINMLYQIYILQFFTLIYFKEALWMKIASVFSMFPNSYNNIYTYDEPIESIQYVLQSFYNPYFISELPNKDAHKSHIVREMGT